MNATAAKIMTPAHSQVQVEDGVLKRVLLLYGGYTLLHNAFFLIGYYLLPEGLMRGSPQVAVGGAIATAGSFWAEFALTLLVNLGVMAGLAVVLNFNRVRGFPVGYLLPISLGVISGLIAGTNSFAADDLSRYNVLEGTALNLSIGGLEMLGYILIIAATVPFGIYHYKSWWRWSGEWKPTREMTLRDVRLSRAEILCLVLGVLLVVLGAYRETVLAMSLAGVGG
jgi:hypothetical protein